MFTVSIWGLSGWNQGLILNSTAWPLEGKLSKEESAFEHACEALFRRAAQSIVENRSYGPIELALDRLGGRILHSHNTIKTLAAAASHAWALDAGTIFRAMYDAYIQASFIVSDPELAEQRARDYLDYEEIQIYKQTTAILSQDNAMSHHIARSPLRESGEARNRTQVEQIRARFVDKNGKLRPTWYQGDLASIARKVSPRLYEEYQWFVSAMNGAVHSASMTLRTGPIVSESHAVFHSSILVARMMRLYLQTIGATLSIQDMTDLDAICSDSLLDQDPSQ